MSDGRDAIKSGEASELAGEYLEASAAYTSALRDADPLVTADAHFHLGRLSWRQSRYDDSVREYEAARALAIRHGARELRARIENGLGAVHHARGAYAQARASYDLALELTSDDTQRARVLLNLGAIANIEGDLATARGFYTRSRAFFQRAAFPPGEAAALHNLGMLNADEGRWDDADDAYRQCLALLESVGDRQTIGAVLVNRSELHCARERHDEAIASCDLALSIFAELGDEASRGEPLRWKGRALRLLGRHEEAERALNESIRLAKRTQVRLLEAEASLDLGLSLLEHDEGHARRWLERALDLFNSLGAHRDVEGVQALLGGLAG